MKNVLIISLLLLFMSGCTMAMRNPFYTPDNESIKGKLLEEVSNDAKGTIWALSESNKLFGMFMIFAVIGGIIGGVTRMKFGWIICVACALGAVSIPLISIFAAAMLKYLWVIGIIVVIAVVFALGLLVLKMYAVAKDSFAYGEGLKKLVSKEDLEKNDELAKAVQPKFVKDTIKFLREK